MQLPDLFDDLDFDPGRLLDHRYQIVACLGNGGMGRVYKAFHIMLDAPVALKELTLAPQDTLEERERAIRRFCREARLLTRLRHPSIPRVLDYFAEEASLYLVMDYIEGVTLAECMGVANDSLWHTPLPLLEALDYACQLCNVLGYLHTQQPAVVFGDLKPSNVILTPDGRAVMVDFGIARPSSSPGDRSSWGRGLAGGIFADTGNDLQPLGTAGYAAPEQYERGWRADPRSDIFALGALLHEMVTGHKPPPFPFGFQPVRAMNPALPRALEQVIERALSFHPEERFQSARQMEQALRLIAQEVAFQASQTDELVVSQEGQAPRATISPPPRHPHTRQTRWKRTIFTPSGIAGATAAIALLLLFFALLSGNQDMAQKALNPPLAAAPPVATETPAPTPTSTPIKHAQVKSLPKHGSASPAGPAPTPSPAPTPTSTPTPSPTAGPSPTPSPTGTPTPGPTPTPTVEPTPGPDPTPSPTLPPTPTPPPAGTPTPDLPTPDTGAGFVALLAQAATLSRHRDPP